MKSIKYSKDMDVLLLELSSGIVDHAVEAGQFIIHYSKTGKPLIIEVMGASKFIAAVETAVYGKSRDEIVREMKRETLRRIKEIVSALSEQAYAADALREDYRKLLNRVVESLPPEAGSLITNRSS